LCELQLLRRAQKAQAAEIGSVSENLGEETPAASLSAQLADAAHTYDSQQQLTQAAASASGDSARAPS
jgi:hypothetical protein